MHQLALIHGEVLPAMAWSRKSAKLTAHNEALHKNGGVPAARALGRFKRERDATQFVQELYQAGATEVIVNDIYFNKNGDEFPDGLLVVLPKDAKRRKAVRRVCARLQKRKLGAFEPDEDIGESHICLSMT